MRIRTTGVDVRFRGLPRLRFRPLTRSQEAQFKFEGFDFQMIDVGGQRYATRALGSRGVPRAFLESGAV